MSKIEQRVIIKLKPVIIKIRISWVINYENRFLN
jgi:hypothetical protein